MVVDKHAAVQSADLRIRTDDGVLLAVHDRGPQTAHRTVVFLHGLCLTRASWTR